MNLYEKKLKIKALLSEGYSYRKIAKEMGIASVSTVAYYVDRMKLRKKTVDTLKPFVEQALAEAKSKDINQVCFELSEKLVENFKIRK